MDEFRESVQPTESRELPPSSPPSPSPIEVGTETVQDHLDEINKIIAEASGPKAARTTSEVIETDGEAGGDLHSGGQERRWAATAEDHRGEARGEQVMEYEASTDRKRENPGHGSEVDQGAGLPLERLHDASGIVPVREGDGSATRKYRRPGPGRLAAAPAIDRTVRADQRLDLLHHSPREGSMFVPPKREAHEGPIYDRGFDDDLGSEPSDTGPQVAEVTLGLAEDGREYRRGLSKEQADEFLAARAAKLRETMLQGPIATLQVEDRSQWSRMLEQLKQVEADRSEDLKAGEPLARELVKIFAHAGGDPTRPLEMLKKAETDAGLPGWLRDLRDELVAEAVKAATVEALKEHVRTELAEAALQALALLFAMPTGPVGAVLLAAHVMNLLQAANAAAR